MVGRGPFQLVEYDERLEPWYVFLHNEAFAGFDPRPREERLTSRPPGPARTFLVADGPLFVGFADLGPPREPLAQDMPDELEIYKIAVLPHYRGRGLGGILVGAMTRFAAGAGVKALHAVVSLLDPRLHVFYERHGFGIERVLTEVEGPGREPRRLVPPETIAAAPPPGLRVLKILYHYKRGL